MGTSSFAVRLLLALGCISALVLFGFIIGTPVALTFLAALATATIFAWRYPYWMLMLWAPVSMMIGWVVAINTGQWRITDTVLQLYTELNVGELLSVALLLGWLLRLVFFWSGRKDQNWKPWFPLLLPFTLLSLAGLVSIFSPASPQPGEVIKFVIRYNILLYLVCIVLVVNLLRSKKRFEQVMTSIAIGSTFFAIGGLISMLYRDGMLGIGRALPPTILGINALGGNQHALAETLIIGMGALLILYELIQDEYWRYWIELSLILHLVVTILTFSRTAWIVLVFAFAILMVTRWKEWAKDRLQTITGLVVLSIPLLIGMIGYTLSSEALGSVSSRAMLASIGFQVLSDSPWVGIGAGHFVQHVEKTRAFIIEFGQGMDAHGILQKVAGELGIVGLLALGILIMSIATETKKTYTRLSEGRKEQQVFFYLALLSASMLLFEGFSTTYWTARLWLPVGLLYAYGRIAAEREVQKDPDFLKQSMV